VRESGRVSGGKKKEGTAGGGHQELVFHRGVDWASELPQLNQEEEEGNARGEQREYSYQRGGEESKKPHS